MKKSCVLNIWYSTQIHGGGVGVGVGVLVGVGVDVIALEAHSVQLLKKVIISLVLGMVV